MEYLSLQHLKKFLIIQTAFIGDVVLATALAEKLFQFFPDAAIDFVVRKGNEHLLNAHPFLNKVWVWDKKKSKNRNLFRLGLQLRKEMYTHVINPHRFASSGLLTYLTGAPHRLGFDKNPLSVFYTQSLPHVIQKEGQHPIVHEVHRNQTLIAQLTDTEAALPKLYPSDKDFAHIKHLQARPYLCIAPSSVWFTKQFPKEKWIDFLNQAPKDFVVYLIGGPDDKKLAEHILSKSTHPLTKNLCGELSFLQSAALQKDAVMNYTNDSAPLHFCSAMQAPVTAIFCSTLPEFGFGPLAENSRVVEIQKPLTCRPCGLHGRRHCPQKHFNCAHQIATQQLLWWI